MLNGSLQFTQNAGAVLYSLFFYGIGQLTKNGSASTGVQYRGKQHDQSD